MSKNQVQLPRYLFEMINRLMKSTLDLGSIACTNQNQLRSYKATVKRSFKGEWHDLAEILLKANVISRCICDEGDFCNICGGARFVFQESSEESAAVLEKLEEGLRKAEKLKLDQYVFMVEE